MRRNVLRQIVHLKHIKYVKIFQWEYYDNELKTFQQIDDAVFCPFQAIE